MTMSPRACAALLSTAALLSFAPPASAGAISFDAWLEFAFTDVGVDATGCDPEDPLGPFCIPSGGTPTLFLDAPPWTFVAPPTGASVTVTDAFQSTDRFELFDFGVSFGLTSAPVATTVVDCGDDPVVCLATAGMSHGSFALGAGAHSITIVPTLSQGGGSGYFLVSAAAVPEPGTIALLAIGLSAIALRRLRRRSH